uniref:Uncharacterized protein n=1 Tax=Microcebus murinus TaxID=30608 RepID=A0A8C5Y3K8_MICMU
MAAAEPVKLPQLDY